MGNGNNPCRMCFCSKVEMCMQEEGLTGLYRILPKHEISRCTYRCWHLSLPFPVFPCKAPPSHRHTHTPAPALMHFYCPHPLFLLSSSTRYHYITVFLHCSATCLASPSLICPACLCFIPLRLSLPLSLLLTQSFSSPPHPSPSDRAARPGIYIAPVSTGRSSRSPPASDFKVSRSLSNRETETGLSRWIPRIAGNKCVCGEQQLVCVSLRHSSPSILVLFTSVPFGSRSLDLHKCRYNYEAYK